MTPEAALPRCLRFRGGKLEMEGVALASLAEKYGTPLYVYSWGDVRRRIASYQEAFAEFGVLVAYAVKANPNLCLLRRAAAMGCGADIVSGGELDRALRAGISAERIVFAGVGKSRTEMAAALRAGIRLFNVESIPELELLGSVAKEYGTKAPVAVRVNPDVDPRTHAYVATGKKESKFGLDIRAAIEAYRAASAHPNLDPIGIHCHIGSQITSTGPFVKAVEKIGRVIRELRGLGIEIRFLDIGGGLGIRYQDETPPAPAELAAAVKPFLKASECRVILEPGRSIVGEAGVLLTRVHYVKQTPIHRYVIVDAAMNDLLRPALYGAYHPIWHVEGKEGRPETTCEIVGPVCETGDFLAKGRVMPLPVAGDLLAVGSAGAYGMAMSSNYNMRLRPAEVVVDGGQASLARRRETFEDLYRCEEVAEDE
ncbi:MAG: diaminopimelate decarboxylase [Candidatus Hydrogenedentota bacterium]|nr:MAG: diaminopimelate decarboxylase [Candidatus Hydrogenedentota bacterium]